MSFFSKLFGKKKENATPVKTETEVTEANVSSKADEDTNTSTSNSKRIGVWQASEHIYYLGYIGQDKENEGIHVRAAYDLNKIRNEKGNEIATCITFGLEFATMYEATVQKLADRHRVSRSTASKRLHKLEEVDPILYQVAVKPILDKNRIDSTKKATEARKKRPTS